MGYQQIALDRVQPFAALRRLSCRKESRSAAEVAG
jgi:hypothetical protein